MKENNYQILIKKLDEFIRKYYTNRLVRGTIYTTAILMASYLLLTILEYYNHFSVAVRTIIFYSFILLALSVFVSMILYPAIKLFRLGNSLSYEQASSIIGKHFSNIQDKLSNILQLKKQSDDLNSSLIVASINQKIAELKPIPFTEAIDIGKNKKYLKYLAIPLMILLALLLFAPGVLKDGTNRLVAHTTEFVPLAPFNFIIENEKLKGLRNEDYELQVKIEGDELPGEVYIELGKESFLMKKKTVNEFSFVFNNLQENTDFRLLASGYYSKFFELKALPKPVLTNFAIHADYPAYTGKPDEDIENFGDIKVPQGTQLQWVFHTDYTKDLQFIYQDSTYNLSQSSEDVYRFSKRIMRGARYGIAAKNDFVKHSDTIFYELTVVPDLFPNIEVKKKEDSLATQRTYFKGFIQDDYGFSRLIFQYQKFGADGSASKPVREELAIDRKRNQNEFFHIWDLNRYPILAAGEYVEFFFEVWDNDAVNGSKYSRSKKMSLKAPSLDELAQIEKKTNKEIEGKLSESIAMIKEIKSEMDALKKDLLQKKELGWQEKKRLEELLEKQRKVQKTIENIQKRNAEMNQKESSLSEVNEEILKKQKLLEEMFEKMMTDEMKKLMEEMQKLMEELNKDQLKDAIEKMSLSNEDLEKELDRNLEIFKQLEFEQKVNETKEKLDELRQEQEDLAKKTQNKAAKTDSLKKEQEKLNKEFDEIRKDLDELKKQNKALEQPNDMPETEKLEEETAEEMQKSSEQLEQKEKSKASESQEGAKKKMDELSQKLSDLQMNMSAGANVENMEDLRALLENLIQLSFDQEDLMKKLEKTDRNNPTYVKLMQEQKKLKDDSKMIEDSLFALSKRVIEIQPTVNREINLINNNMGKALEEMGERRTAAASSRQQLAMTSINNLALLLDQALQQMQMQMQMAGKGSCKKPGGKGSPSLSDIKKMQQQLSEQLQKMKDAMQGGKKPGAKEGSKSGQGGTSKQLAELAAKQAAIRRKLEQMQEQLGKGSGGGGNLEKLSKMMEETEKDIVNKNITPETIERQKKILTRLLESEKAEKERERDNKRESREVTEENYRNQNIFFEYNKEKEKETELLKTVPPGFNIFYKNKVSDYLNQVKK